MNNIDELKKRIEEITLRIDEAWKKKNLLEYDILNKERNYLRKELEELI